MPTIYFWLSTSPTYRGEASPADRLKLMRYGRKQSRIRHPQIHIGGHVRFAGGTFAGTGVVDAAAADYTIIQVWTDGGAGPRVPPSLSDRVGLSGRRTPI
jgi:hypothetical protein